MQIAAKRNLVLTTVSSLSQPGGTNQAITQEELYQHIVSALTKASHKTLSLELGQRLIIMAEHALNTRETNIVEQVSQILINAPLLGEYRNIGHYYWALCITRGGDPAASTTILENLAASPATPLRYRARALKAIGGNHLDLSSIDEAFRFFLEAAWTASEQHGRDLLTATLSHWMMAVIRSIYGDHKGALAGLEKLSSPVRLLSAERPFIFYSYVNSLAVELCELGRIEEARNASNIALSSPFAHQYLELRETAKEVAQKARRASRSVVSLCSRAPKLDDRLQEATGRIEAITPPTTEGEPPSGNLVVFPSSSDRPARTSADPFDRKLTPSDLRWMTTAQKRSLVIEIAQATGVADELLERMMQAAGVVISEADEDFDNSLRSERPDILPEEASAVESVREERDVGSLKKIDLDAKNHLEVITSLMLAGNLGPYGFAAIMSALRDCEDDERRRNLIDRMITHSFHEAREQTESEDEWRRRVEARLAPAAGTN